jgi:hypothetical protein
MLCAFALLALGWGRVVEAEEGPTLDLEKQAAYALNGLNGTVNEDGHFMFRCRISPPEVSMDAISYSACHPKYVESLAMMQLMTGIDIRGTQGQKTVDYMVDALGEDGLFYAEIGDKRPWDHSSPEDYANMYGQGRALRAMLAWYDVTKDEVWAERMKAMVSTLVKIAIRKTDPETGKTYAYYPTTPGYGDIFCYPKSGWKTTELLTGEQENMADMPDHTFGIPLYLGGMIEGIVRYGRRFNDPQAMELAEQLVNLVVKKEYGWIPAAHPKGVVPEEKGQFQGHFHAHTVALRGVLEYAIATDDRELKEFVRHGYEYARLFGVARLGWFEEYTGRASHETCGLANMTALALKLSLAGVGDYWDDVDGYVRNHLTRAQYTNLEKLREMQGEPLTEEQEQTLRRMLGTFSGWGSPTINSRGMMNCCVGNGSQALYYVWDSAVRQRDDVIQVNLLLDRKSPWVDVRSSLPYEGRVSLKVKQGGMLSVRIPQWVDKTAVELSANGQRQAVNWVDRNVLVPAVEAGSEVVLAFPVVESVETYTVFGDDPWQHNAETRTEYTIHFRGNTAMTVEPIRDEHFLSEGKKDYAIYRGEPDYAVEPPISGAADYVAAERIDW